MGTIGKNLRRVGNHIGVWLYRTLGGRLSGGSKNVNVLMITAPGRRTGQPRSACVGYLETDSGFLIWGTGAGAPRDPDWFRNLRAAGTVDVQVMTRHFRLRPRELTGDERSAMWAEVVLAQAPEVAKYARKAGRTIPLALLEPIDSSRLEGPDVSFKRS